VITFALLSALRFPLKRPPLKIEIVAGVVANFIAKSSLTVPPPAGLNWAAVIVRSEDKISVDAARVAVVAVAVALDAPEVTPVRVRVSPFTYFVPAKTIESIDVIIPEPTVTIAVAPVAPEVWPVRVTVSVVLLYPVPPDTRVVPVTAPVRLRLSGS